MSDALRDNPAPAPWRGDPDETDLERREAEEPDFRQSEEAEEPDLRQSEEDRLEPGAGDLTAGDAEAPSEAAEVPSAEEHQLSDEPENEGGAPLVAGHTAESPAADEADGSESADGLAPATPFDAQHEANGSAPATSVDAQHEAEGSAPATPVDAQRELGAEDAPVFDSASSTSFRERWSTILSEFIDDPRRAVEDADRFVADVTQAFASGVESRRQSLTSAWGHDGHDQTEDLRLTMRQYRMLVDRILTVSATAD
jgi:hypothetical protein